jgi:hypothetical protein
MSLASAAAELVQSLIEMPGRFADVAAHDPLNPVLMLFGVLFVAGSVGMLGYLTLGALVEFFIGGIATEPPREAQ